MALQLRRIRPWDSGSPFGHDFRELINEIGEAAYRYEEIETELIRVIMTPPLRGDVSEVQASFPVIIQGTLSTDWPKEYDWAEAEHIGSGQGTAYTILSGGRNSTDMDDEEELLFGLAINRVELIPGFGTNVGPYGQLLSDQFLQLTVQPIRPNSFTLMILETNSDGDTVPMFSAYNPMTSDCRVFPGVPPDIAV